MATIGNRYESLLLDARDPLDASKKKKKSKISEHSKSNPKTSQKSDSTKKAAVNAQNDKSTEILKKPTKVLVKDVKPINSAEILLAPSDPCETLSTSTQIKVTVYSQDVDRENQKIIEKDNRALRPRNTYQKMIVNRGRVYDRRGATSSSAYHAEKRHGHGAYNWGEEGKVDSSQIDLDGSLQPAETAPEVVVEKERIEYTLDQYKELLRENKIDPLAYVENNILCEKAETVEEETNTREYQYFRNNDESQRGRASGRPYRGRGSSRGRGRGYRGQSEPRSNESHRGNITVSKPFVFDEIKDFPSL
ncbi:hypothetical protein MXB_1414 [Myxobolus squamalis]|nr:hypothetical protein MXB_1414 [Myxobolus squamalis]